MTGGITQENVRKSGILSMALILRLLPVQLFSWLWSMAGSLHIQHMSLAGMMRSVQKVLW